MIFIPLSIKFLVIDLIYKNLLFLLPFLGIYEGIFSSSNRSHYLRGRCRFNIKFDYLLKGAVYKKNDQCIVQLSAILFKHCRFLLRSNVLKVKGVQYKKD